LLYSLLYLFGFPLTLDDLKSFRQLGSKTSGHPEYEYSQHAGVEATTGPLGQGFTNAVGMAIAEAHLAAVYNRAQTIVDHYTYCLAGDVGPTAAEARSSHYGLGLCIELRERF
jgi:transketolase